MGIKPFLAIFGTHMRATNSQSNLIVMNAAETTVAIYKMQYYINVISSQGDPTPSAWIDVGIDFPFPRRAHRQFQMIPSSFALATTFPAEP